MKTRPGYHSEQLRNLAFEEVLKNLTQREAAVYQMILEFAPVSTEKVAELMGVQTHFITGRIKTLRDELQLIEICGETITEGGNRKAALYKPSKWDPQLALNL